MFVENEEFLLSEKFGGFEPAGGSGLRESDVGNRSGTQTSGKSVLENGSVFPHHAPGIHERRRGSEIRFIGSVAVEIGESEKMRQERPVGAFFRKPGRQFVRMFSPASPAFYHERSRAVGDRSENPAEHVSEGAVPITVLGTFRER